MSPPSELSSLQRKIINAIANHPQPMSAAEISKELKIALPTSYNALRLLREQGLIFQSPDGNGQLKAYRVVESKPKPSPQTKSTDEPAHEPKPAPILQKEEPMNSNASSQAPLPKENRERFEAVIALAIGSLIGNAKVDRATLSVDLLYASNRLASEFDALADRLQTIRFLTEKYSSSDDPEKLIATILQLASPLNSGRGTASRGI